MYRGLLLSLSALVILPATVCSQPLTFTTSVVANYEFSLLGGTPLNPGPTTPFLPFQAVGDLTFTLDPSLNNPAATTVPFTNATGVLQGVPPSPPNTLPHTISPNLQFLGGSLTNIARNGGGLVLSADVSNLSMRWVLIGMNPAFPVTLYSQVGLPFSATGVSIPFQPGNVLEGDAPFNIFLDDGDGNTANDLIVAIGQNRTLTAVPEPTALALTGLAGQWLTCRRFSRRSESSKKASVEA